MNAIIGKMDVLRLVAATGLLGCGWSMAQHAPAAETPAEQESGKTEGSVVQELEELIVIASRTQQAWIDTSGSVLRVDAEQMERLGVHDLGGFAKYDPTVSLPFDFSSGDGAYAYGQTGYGSINIRGIEGNRIAMELDGIRQPPQYLSTSFDMGSDDGAGGVGRDYFDPAMFDVVEVFKGGASALYGSDALGGVVSFRTPEPESFLQGRSTGALLRGQYFSVNDSVVAQAGGAVRSGDTSILLLGVYREGHETKNNGSEDPNPADFDSDSWLLKIHHRMGDHLFRFALEGFQRDTSVDVRSAVTSAFPVFTDYVHNRQSLERLRSSLHWDYDAKASWVDRVEGQLYWQDSESRSDSDSASLPLVIGGNPLPGTERTRQQQIRFDTTLTGASLLVRKEFGDPDRLFQTVIFGTEASLESSENAFDRVDTGEPSEKTSFAPTDTWRSGVYVQDEIRFARRWFITPGIRLDWQRIEPDPNQAYLDHLASLGSYGQELPEDYDNVSVAPRVNVAWKPRPWMQWYGSYSRGVRNPSAEELSMIFDHPAGDAGPAGTLTVPNPGLKEERSDAFELGAKAEGSAGRMQAAGYYTRYSNFIENGVDTGRVDDDGRTIVTSVNRGRAEIYGFELGGSLELGYFWRRAEGWEVGLNTGKSFGTNESDDTWLNSVEPWKTVAYLGYEDPEGRYGVRLTGVYTDAVKRVDDTTNQGTFYRPPSWFTMDLGAYWKPQETLTVHVGLNNLFDEKYWMWSSVRRGNGHLGGNSVTDRTTAPGRNVSLSVTKTF